eukprot:Gb_31603 [translate_table: standard]
MCKRRVEASPTSPKYIELREHDEEELREHLRKMPEEHPCNIAQSTNFISSGIQIEGLRDKTTRRIAKLMAIKLVIAPGKGNSVAGPTRTFGIFEVTCMDINLWAWKNFKRTCRHPKTQLQLAVEIVTTEVEGKTEKEEVVKSSMTTPSHGQSSESRQVEDAEESRRKKRKFIMEEDVVHDTPKTRSQPSSKKEATTSTNQMPILPLPDYLNNRFRLEWPEAIPDGFINLNYADRWKVFEEGLDKKECYLWALFGFWPLGRPPKWLNNLFMPLLDPFPKS